MKPLTYKYILRIQILFFLLSSFSNYGQVQGGEYRFRNISSNSTLGLEGVKSICQDKDGFMWIITSDELYRFDGLSFIRYSEKLFGYDSRSEFVRFQCVYRDFEDDLYLGTSIGVFQFDGETNGFSLIYSKPVDQIQEDIYARLWFVGKEINIFNKETKETTNFRYNEDNSSYNNVLCADSSGNVFLSTELGKISAIAGNEREIKFIYSFSENTKVVSLYVLDNWLWILTETKGLFVLDIKEKRIVKKYDFFLQKNENITPAKSFFVDTQKKIWIGTQQGLYLLDPVTDSYQLFLQNINEDFSIIDNSIWTITDDQDGNLWFGTRLGISFLSNYDRSKFNNVTLADYNFVQKAISSFAKKDNELWFGTEGGGVYCYDENRDILKSYQHEPKKNSLKYNNVKSLLLQDEYLWLAMYKGGLDRLDLKTGQFKNFNEKDLNKRIVSNDIKKLQMEKDLGMWIIYQSVSSFITFVSFKDGSSQHYFLENTKDKEKGGDDRFLDMCRGEEDKLWLISSDNLFMFDTKERQYKLIIRINDHIRTDRPMNMKSIYYDSVKSVLWIGTRNQGLIRYDVEANEFKIYDSILKFGYVTINSIIGDKRGNIWLGGNAGLYKFDVTKECFYYYDENDGILNPTHCERSGFLSAEGIIFFGNTKGFVYFNPNDIEINNIKPKILIGDFLINNKSIFADSLLLINEPKYNSRRIKLAYNQNNVGIELSCTNYLMPMKNRYRYRLKNYDNKWIEVGALNRSVFYQKLPAGRYSFEAQAANNDGVWGETYSMDIIIKPAPWNSNLAYVFYFMLISSAVYYFYREKNRRNKLKNEIYLAQCRKRDQEENHQAQLQFFTNITHDFKTPLTLILGTLELLEKDECEISQTYFDSLKTNSRRLLKLVNEVIDFRTVENGMMKLQFEEVNFNNFICDLVSDVRDYLYHKNIKLNIHTDSRLSRKLLIAPKITEKILMNLLDNAFKYTSNGGSISIETFYNISDYKTSYSYTYTEGGLGKTDEKMFGFIVRDTGIGISEESISKVFNRFYRVEDSENDSHLGSGIGLALVKSLILLYRGFITIASQRGVGTDIVVGFPMLEGYAEKQGDGGEESNDVMDMEIVLNDEEIKLPELSFLNERKVKPHSILFVEDNEEIKQLVFSFLSERFDVTVVSNGEEALNELENKAYDLILSDWMMPIMDGITLCRNVKNNPNLSYIPFILMTVKSGVEDQLEGFGTGAEAYLVKPINFILLQNTINNLLRLKDSFRIHFADNYFIDTAESTVNKKTNNTFDKFIDIIHRRIEQEEIDFDEIAKEMGMSRRKLFSFVKTNTNKSIVEFVRTYRIRLAARIMVEEQLSTKEVMMRVGIESASYFSKVFKNEFGDTPSVFKVKMKNKRNF